MKTLLNLCLVCLPLKHLQVNSAFGYRIHPLTGNYALHTGVDLQARHDTVYAVLGGLVEFLGYNDHLGVYIRLQHGPIESLYGHLDEVLVRRQDLVMAGEPIAITGTTGRVTGEHLHFSVCFRHQYINPIKFLYELLIKNKNEQKFQSTAGTAFRQADRGN